MPARTAQTIWRGSIETGNGKVELASSHAGRYDVSFPRRTAERGGGTTSPEELIAAAHSSCYAMQLSAIIGAAGRTRADWRSPQMSLWVPTRPAAFD